MIDDRVRFQIAFHFLSLLILIIELIFEALRSLSFSTKKYKVCRLLHLSAYLKRGSAPNFNHSINVSCKGHVEERLMSGEQFVNNHSKRIYIDLKIVCD